MELAGLIAWALDHLSYGVVFLLMLLENSVVPLPAELIVTPAAYKAANGEMDAAVLIVVSTLGSIAGAIVNYYLSLWIGRPLIYRFADSRWGRLMFLSGKKLEYAENLFRDVYRPLASCRPSVHIDSCRTCADEFWRICLLHGGGFGHLELVAGGSGVLLDVFASGGRNCAGVGEIWHAGQCRFFRLAFCFACRLCGEALCAPPSGEGIERRILLRFSL